LTFVYTVYTFDSTLTARDMKVTNLNFYRDENQPENINVLRELVKEHIIDKGGVVAFNWNMQQCGYSLWYDCKGYIGENECVKIRYTYR
jgi:hypothetical protein